MTRSRRIPIVLGLLLATALPARAEVSEFTVDGLSVILKRVPNSAVVSAGLYLKGGSVAMKPEQAGIERFLFTVAARASMHYPKEELSARMDRMGSSIGVDAQFDYTALNLRCLRQHFEPSWDIFADVIQHPALDSLEVALVRERLLTGLKREVENPDRYISRLANGRLYAGHPYSTHMYGTEASITALSGADLRAHYEARMTRGRMLLVVVGDLEKQDLKDRVKRTLSDLRKGKGKLPDLPDVIATTGGDLNLAARDIPTVYVLGVHPAPNLASPDFYPFMVATRILRNRLWEEVRTKRNLAYAVSSGYSQRATNYGYIWFASASPDTTLRVIHDEIRKLQREPVGEKDLGDQISLFITDYFERLETAASQNDFLARYEIIGNGWEETERFVSKLRKVKPKDVQRVAKQYMMHYHHGVVGDSTKVDRGLFTEM